MPAKKSVLITGDILLFALLTIFGFATHGETGASFIPRMGTTFLPLLLGWFLIAPWFGLLDETVTSNVKMLWRIPSAMLFVAPLAVVLRAALLHSTALPIFALVLGGMNALGMLAWRAIYIYLFRKSIK
ncbi:MAG: DUF3054 family protein [Chloroflexi bacterium]|nr:DUF3054 family protein [Chloroflexota bacterium]